MANKISVVIDVAVERANAGLASFKKSIQDADGAAGKFKAGAASVGSSLKANFIPVAGAAGLAVTAFATKAVNAASDLEESTNAVGVSFGEAAEDVLKLGENSADSFGLSKSAFNDAAVGFSSFAADVAGENGDVAATLNDLMTRAADMASVFNVEVPEAALAMKSALSGEAEPMKRFGIVMTEAKVQAYALRTGIIRQGQSMNDAQKQTARYGFIMEETAKVQGDWAKTSDGLAGTQKKLGATVEDLQAKIGVALVPIVAAATGEILDLVEALETVPGAVDDIPGASFIAKLSAQGWQWLKLGGGVTDYGAALDATNAAIARYISAARQAGEGTGGYYNAAKDAAEYTEQFASAADLAGRGLGGYANAANDARANTDQFGTAAKQAADATARLIVEVDDLVSSMFDGEQSAIEFAQSIDDLRQNTEDTTEVLADSKATDEEKSAALRQLRLDQISVAEGALEQAKAYATEQGAAEGSVESTQKQIDYLSILKGQYPEIADDIQKMIDALLVVPGSFDPAKAAMETGGTEIGKRLGDGVIAGISSRQGAIDRQAELMVEKALIAATGAAKIKSPSKLFADEVGSPIAEGVAEGIIEDADKIGDALAKAIESAEGDAIKAAEELVDAASDALDGFWKGIDGGRSLIDMQEGVADAQARLDEVMADPESTAKERADALERLQDANYRLAKATADNILVDKQARESWRKTAEAAGIAKSDIDGIIASYLELARVKGEAAATAAGIRSEADAANAVRDHFAEVSRAGLISSDQLTHMSTLGSGGQIDYMKIILNNLATLFGQVPQYAKGGVVPGTGPQMAVVHGGETIIPAGQGGGGATYNFTINDASDPDRVVQAIRQFVRRNGPIQGIT